MGLQPIASRANMEIYEEENQSLRQRIAALERELAEAKEKLARFQLRAHDLVGERDRLRKALEDIKNGEGAPSVDPQGDGEFGLHCGVEDRCIEDRYAAANYGYASGMERGLEWATNEATEALASTEKGEAR